MRSHFARKLPTAIAFAGWSSSVLVHATALCVLWDWGDSEPELAGPVGHSSMALSVADPSPGVEIEEENATDIGVPLAGDEHKNLSETVAPATPPLVQIDQHEVEPMIAAEQAVHAEPSPDGLLVMLSADDPAKEAADELAPADPKEPVDAPPEINEPQADQLAENEKPDDAKVDATAKPVEEAKSDLQPTVAISPPTDLPKAAHPMLGDDTPTSSPPSMSIVGTSDRADPTFDRNAPIIYPAIAIQNGYEGTVLLRVRIAADGRVVEVQIVQSSGYPILDNAALDTVRTRRGHPAHSGGRPIEKTALFPVVFQLH